MTRLSSKVMPDRRYFWATAVVFAGIIYASLFPFHFHQPPGIRGPLTTLISTWNYRAGRGDLVANVLLYMPLGLFAGLALRRKSAGARVLVATCAGMALSFAMELTQFYEAGREQALSDVYTNTLGTLLGAISASAVIAYRGHLVLSVRINRRYRFALILIAAWLAFRLFPYVPVIDLHKYWGAVKPLIFSPEILAPRVYYYAACWLALAFMLEAILGAVASRVAMVALIGLVTGGRILITGIVLSPNELLGALAAAAVWMIAPSRFRHSALTIAVLFTAAVITHGLEPFTFQTPPRAFEWVPFRPFIDGSPELSAPSFLQKTFLYGSAIWLIARAGAGLRGATVLIAGLVFSLSQVHRFLPERSCDVTDALMVLILAGLFRMMEDPPNPRVSSTPNVPARQNSAGLVE
jgi:hypothetical protein